MFYFWVEGTHSFRFLGTRLNRFGYLFFENMLGSIAIIPSRKSASWLCDGDVMVGEKGTTIDETIKQTMAASSPPPREEDGLIVIGTSLRHVHQPLLEVTP